MTSQMNSYFEELSKAFKDVHHMINVTYKFVKEPKLLLTILDKLYDISIKLIDIILYDNYSRKNISLIPKTNEAKIVLFDEKLSPLYDFGEDLVELIKHIDHLKQIQKKSLVISKDNKVVFYIDNYTTEIFSLDDANQIYHDLYFYFEELKKEISS